jgi:medium-chain acyl-[acyl-carrier-protein] hydrolase
MTTRWFPFGTRPEAPVRLLTLPHAGAGAGPFRGWGRGLPASIGVVPVEPPGRGRRGAEPPFTRVGPLAEELAGQISASVGSPYALFGHSTGALCAFEVIRELRRTGGPLPVHLFVSGRPAPQAPRTPSDLAGLSASELEDYLRELGGTPEVILSDHEILLRIQPVLAADFAVDECYTFEPDQPLDIAITAFAGRNDPDADGDLMADWKERTTAGFALHELDGGHFAIFDEAPRVHAEIADALSDHCPGERRLLSPGAARPGRDG